MHPQLRRRPYHLLPVFALAAMLICTLHPAHSAAAPFTQATTTLYLPLAVQPTIPTLAYTSPTTAVLAALTRPSLGPSVFDDFFLLTISSGTVRQVARNIPSINGLSWSRDGRYVGVSSNGLAVADSASATFRRITSTWPGLAAWQPWDDRIAFTDSVSETTNLFIAHPDGTQRSLLAPNGTRYFAPVWSPDGTHIAAAAQAGLFTLTPDGRSVVPITAQASYDYSWSPDGRMIAYLTPIQPDTSSLDLILWVAQADGSAAHRVSPAAAGAVANLHWSPDGSRIAYHGVDALWISDPSGLNQAHTQTANVQDFVWSPDGQQVAYTTLVRVTPNAQYRLSVVNADGSGEQELVAPTDTFSRFLWSADSAQLFYVSAPPNERLYTVQRRQAGNHALLATPVSHLFGQTGAGRLIIAQPQGSASIVASLEPDGSDIQKIATIAGGLEIGSLSP